MRGNGCPGAQAQPPVDGVHSLLGVFKGVPHQESHVVCDGWPNRKFLPQGNGLGQLDAEDHCIERSCKLHQVSWTPWQRGALHQATLCAKCAEPAGRPGNGVLLPWETLLNNGAHLSEGGGQARDLRRPALGVSDARGYPDANLMPLQLVPCESAQIAEVLSASGSLPE